VLQVTPIRALRDNYVWMIHRPGGRSAVVVDPGESSPVESALANAGLTPVAILVTHHHHDHVGGIQALLQRHRVPVFGPATESIPSRSHPVSDGDEVHIDELSLTLTAIHVPGHTLGAIAYVGEGIVLTGDTLFTAGCGRLFEGTPAQMLASLRRLAALPSQTRVYCGHEYTVANLRFAHVVEPDNPDIEARLAQAVVRAQRGEPGVPSTIGEERLTNPFLRVAEPTVRSAVQSKCARPLSDPGDVFAELRNWKNHF
jgi:hydroxyacylglutathione hydrolase